ncbi:MAG: hypothetical protein R2772_05005 [Chitinophagales bacterium]
MHTIIYTTFLFLLSSCSQSNDCKNRFDLIHSNDSIPNFAINYSESTETTLARLNQIADFDPCERCGWVQIKSPFVIEGKNGFLPVTFHFDYMNCPNCPIVCTWERNYFEILVNAKSQILAEQEFVVLDSLHIKIDEYLKNIGTNYYPQNYTDFFYYLKWDRNVDSLFLNEVFTKTYSAHINFIERKKLDEGIDLCSLNNAEIKELKSKYPFRLIIAKPVMFPLPMPQFSY